MKIEKNGTCDEVREKQNMSELRKSQKKNLKCGFSVLYTSKVALFKVV